MEQKGSNGTITGTPRENKSAPHPLVEVAGVVKNYGPLPVLRGVDLTVNRGEVFCIIGPSGSGKSTLLRCINHLEAIDAGTIRVDGELVGYREQSGRLYELRDREVRARRRRIGMVFQQFNLFGHMTALENVVAAPMWVLGESKADARLLGREMLDRVGVLDKADTYPSRLSGGQQQRVAVARSLAMRPVLMLLDEPTSALDPELVGEVLDVIQKVAESGMTMIVVTHEMNFAREVCSELIMMDEGTVVERGDPTKVLVHPEAARTRAFLSRLL